MRTLEIRVRTMRSEIEDGRHRLDGAGSALAVSSTDAGRRDSPDGAVALTRSHSVSTSRAACRIVKQLGHQLGILLERLDRRVALDLHRRVIRQPAGVLLGVKHFGEAAFEARAQGFEATD